MAKKIVYIPTDKESDISVSYWDRDIHIEDVEEKQLYTFTEKELNQYTESIIKKALEIAAEKVKHEEYKFDGKQPSIDKESITNTFEEVYKNFKL